MKHINYLSDSSVNVVLKNGNLKLNGLQSLDNLSRERILKFTKQNKQQLIYELLCKRADEVADWMDNPNSAGAEERQAQLPKWEKMVEEIAELERILQIPEGRLSMTITVVDKGGCHARNS